MSFGTRLAPRYVYSVYYMIGAAKHLETYPTLEAATDRMMQLYHGKTAHSIRREREERF